MRLTLGSHVREQGHNVGRLAGLEIEPADLRIRRLIVSSDGQLGPHTQSRPLAIFEHVALPAVRDVALVSRATRMVGREHQRGRVRALEIDPETRDVVSVTGRAHWWSPSFTLRRDEIDASQAGEIRYSGHPHSSDKEFPMKRVVSIVSAACLLGAATLLAQGGGQMQGQKVGIATSLQRGYAGFKNNFTQAAEKMPEADYSFKPGSTPEARTFAQVIDHIAQAQFGGCSNLAGKPNPMQGKNLEQELKTKAEVTKALADSFAICDGVFAEVTDANATEMVKQGPNEVTRAAALFGVLVHGNEMYGTAAVYLRSKNIVPPSTENAGRGMRGRGF